MKISLKIISWINKYYRALRLIFKAIKIFLRDGGYSQVNISQLNHGEILKGKKILITGGSVGIGFAIAQKCLSEGAEVVITGRSVEKLEKAKEKLNSDKLHILTWDISDLSILESKYIESKGLLKGSIDMLVNNAGLLGGNKSLFNLTEELWDKITNVNIKSLVFLTKQISNDWIMQKNKGKKIVNISSMRGILGVVDGPYGISKWGVVGLTQGLGKKLISNGIIVNGIAPGIINTESLAFDKINTDENVYLDCNPPIYRIGLPEEIAELAVFLMSDAANYIVGQTIICDGGYTLKT